MTAVGLELVWFMSYFDFVICSVAVIAGQEASNYGSRAV